MSFKIAFLFIYMLFIAQSKEKIIETSNIEKTDIKSNTMETNLPNILFLMADDLGWGNVAWPGHNTKNDEINTPNIDQLVANGLQLNRHYVYTGCAPARASFQTGRLPIHCTINNDDGLEDATHGIPTQMTTIASKLKQAGYKTNLIGKWDAGFATYDKLPINKGYDSFYGYLSKSINYFSKLGDNDCGEVNYIDMWENNAPAGISLEDVDTNSYLEFMFMDRVNDLINSYSNSNDPFFLMYSMHLPHYPSEIPQTYLQTFPNDENTCQVENDYIYPNFTNGTLFQCRSTLQSQVNLMDHIIGKVIDTLKQNNLYDNTLIVFSTDNGGSLELDVTAGNNYPLRGGKSNFLEGGIRATSFVSGGFLPEIRRGQIESGIMHIADWYATFCAIAGVDANDYDGMQANLPNIDGINMWPLISGEVIDSPRYELMISKYVLIQGKYKFLIGNQRYAVWQGVYFPNVSTTDQDALEYTWLPCKAKGGCLFDVVNDPYEHNDLSNDMQDLTSTMNERLQELSATVFKNTESGVDSCPTSLWDSDTLSCGCWMAMHNYNYFAGPYQDLEMDQIHFTEDSVDDELILNKFDNETKERIKQDNYVVYLGLVVMIFVGIIACIKYCKGIENKSTEDVLNRFQRESYGAT